MSELRAVGLKKTYRSRTVVHDVSLSLRSGEVVGLLGPNGAGKTTSFYMIVGLVSADGGEIFIDDQNITHLPIHRRARLGLGYLPQEASIFRRMTVEQNIQAVLELQALSDGDLQTRLEQLLASLGTVYLVMVLTALAEYLSQLLTQPMVFRAQALRQLHQLRQLAFQSVQFCLHGTNYSLINPDKSNGNDVF